MKYSDIVLYSLFVGTILIVFALVIVPKLEQPIPETIVIDEVVEREFWCPQHHKLEETWEIKGRVYLVRRSLKNYPEIVGLYTRFHNSD